MSCHVREAEEWRGSLHHRSDTDAAYRRAFAVEPSPFCRACHAPESDPAREPPPAVSELGVGCVTCHVTEEGLVLAAPAAEGGRAPHPLRRSADFAKEGGCAGCHEFRFPMAPRGSEEDAHFMQTTVREHARSPSADRPCASCHMPEVGGHRSHSFAEVRDPAWLRSHLRAAAEMKGNVVRITLAQTDPGHGYPTGDLFRRLEVGCELRGARRGGAGGEVLRRDVRYLDRRFELVPAKAGRALRSDTRVFDEPRVIDLDATPPPGAQGATVRWWVTYQRVATVGVGTRPEAAQIESEVQLYSGEMPRAAGR